MKYRNDQTEVLCVTDWGNKNLSFFQPSGKQVDETLIEFAYSFFFRSVINHAAVFLLKRFGNVKGSQ
jgi:hypothetical protein